MGIACVVLWIQNTAGKVLNISRKDNQSKFGLIGGKVDDIDFDIRSALNREVLEETGVDISAAPHRDMVTFEENGVPVHCFILGDEHCHLFPSAAYQNAEGTYVGWSQLYRVLGRDYCDFHEYNNKVYQYLFKEHKFADHLALGKQHVFDFVSRHLLTQNAKSVNPNGSGNYCMYLSLCKCMKCAVGCLIHPLEYRSYFEGKGSGNVSGHLLTMEQLADTREARTLLRELQLLHDCPEKPVESWKEYLQDIADDFDLNNSVLVEYAHLVT